MSLDLSRSLALSRHADLKTRKDGPVLVLPERAIRIHGTGAEILRLVAEKRSVASVLSAMRERYPESSDSLDAPDAFDAPDSPGSLGSPGSPDVESDVLGFLEEMLRLGALVEVESGCERSR